MGNNFGGHFPAVRKTNNDRERLMFVAAAGLAFSLLVILIVVFNYRSAKATAPVQPQVTQPDFQTVGTVTLYQSDKFIRSGSKLSEYKFKEVFWPRNNVPDGAVRDLSELRGKFAKNDIPNGQPLLRVHLTRERNQVTLPITPGMRAVTINIDSRSSIEGWARPGTRVDVVLTHSNQGELTSKVIVQNARVLSYGGDATQLSDKVGGMDVKRVRAGNTITLEVAPADALRVQTSRQMGALSLLMRAPEDNQTVDKLEITKNEVDGAVRGTRGRTKNCSKGVMRIEGKEYVIDCDGSIAQLANDIEP
jgi:pilus assembly protein CpaB